MHSRLGAIFGVAASMTSAVPARAQTIDVTPTRLVFAAAECASNPAPQTISVTNTGSGVLSWQLATPLPPGFAISPMAGTAPSTVTIQPPAGLPVGIHRFILEVKSNDPATSSVKVEIVVVIHPCLPARSKGQPPSPPAMYEVLFLMTGFAGEFSTLPDCKVNTNGFDKLMGTLVAYEPNTPDDDVVYKGVFVRQTAVDYCMTKGRRNPGDDERVYCTVSLRGADIDEVELNVYGDAGRGAWLKATPLKMQVGQLAVSFTAANPSRSNCDARETKEVTTGYGNADDGGGLSPNGTPISDLNATYQGQPVMFVVNRIAKLRLGDYQPDKKSGTGDGWTLFVIKKLQ